MPNILTLVPLSDADRQRIEAVDPSVRLFDAGGWFDGDYRETWPRYAVDLYVAPDSAGKVSRSERDALLDEAGIVLACQTARKTDPLSACNIDPLRWTDGWLDPA